MATDVIIDPSTGQIYWNDSAGVGTESISIKGDAVNAISFTGYSASFSPGSTPAGAQTLVTIKDSGGTDALIPGTTGYNLGSSTLRWNTFATNANLSGVLLVGDATNTTSLTTGAVKLNGGIAISSNASIGQTLLFFNGANYTGLRSGATGNTVYTLPATSPATGSSVLSSTSAGVMSWVPLATASGTVNSGTANFAAYYATTSSSISENANLQFTGTGLSIGGNISSSSTLTGSLIVRGGLGITGNAFIGSTVTIQDTTISSSTTTGALVVAGGIGVGGKVFADVLQSGGNAAIGGNLSVAGTVDLGNAITDTISFLGRVDTDIDPISNNTYDLGVPGLAFRNAAIGNSLYFTNTSNSNTFAFTAGATGATLTYILPIDTPTAGQVLAASAISGDKVTLSWEDDQTGAPAGGITTLNTLTAASQSFATGTSGTDFAISSATSTHTFNLPDAGSSARGVVSTGTQTFAGAKTFSSALVVSSNTVSTSSSTGALTVTGGVGIGGSLYTSTGSSSSVSGVILANGNVSATTYNKLILTAPATSATLTLANSSSLITSGANSLTLTTTAASNVTFPTAGILTTQGNKLSVFALTSGSELAGVISDKTGTGNLVFASSPSLTTPTLGVASATSINKVTITAPTTSATLTLVDGSTLTTAGAFGLTLTTTAASNVTFPTAGTLLTSGATSPNFLTSVSTGSGTFALYNTTATTINAFGAATVMSIGAATGKATFNSTDNSTSVTTGGLVVSGGAGIAKSVSIGGRLQMFNGANFTAFVSSAS